MNKTSIILLCVVVALVSGIIGFVIGTKTIICESDNSSSVIGTYRTNSWNGEEAVLVIKEDGTLIYPTGQRATWIYEDNHLYIPAITETGEEKRQELELVDGGIMINTTFFEKVK